MQTGREGSADVVQRAGLLARFMVEAPHQPATNLWRCIEVPVLAACLPRTGLGLDVGCGDGHLTRLLAELGGAQWTLVGVDPDPAEAEMGRLSGRYVRVHANGADAIPEADGSFAFAFANSVLEHIPDVRPCLAEVARVLAPGGLFAATVPSAYFHAALRAPADPERRAAFLHDLDERVAHRYYWTEERWSEELARVGLAVERFVAYVTRRQARRWQRLSALTGGLLYRIAGRRWKPIQIQRGLGMRRGLPVALRPLAPLAATVVGAGVLGDVDPDPAGNAGLLFVARKS